MTTYAGETLVITHTATNEDVALTDANVLSVTVEIFDSDGATLVDETEMTWDAVQERWEYVWYTIDDAATPAALEPGTYRAKVLITSLTGTENWEYKRIRLARNPV
jgi:hypothetical protein